MFRTKRSRGQSYDVCASRRADISIAPKCALHRTSQGFRSESPPYDGSPTGVCDLSLPRIVPGAVQHACSAVDQCAVQLTVVRLWAQCKDQSATLYDTTTLEPLKTYKSDRPINSAAISPLMDHVYTLNFPRDSTGLFFLTGKSLHGPFSPPPFLLYFSRASSRVTNSL